MASDSSATRPSGARLLEKRKEESSPFADAVAKKGAARGAAPSVLLPCWKLPLRRSPRRVTPVAARAMTVRARVPESLTVRAWVGPSLVVTEAEASVDTS